MKNPKPIEQRTSDLNGILLPKLSRIEIEVIPHEKQRYDTVGDWYYRKDADLATGKLGQVLVIRVSELGDWRYNALVALHELVEVLLCRHDGVTQEEVDRFDMDFEAHRKREDDSEPGDHPAAPYRKQHLLATGIEKMLAAWLGVYWKSYDERILKL